jgi:two-component system chemotaxis response regulator CheY
MPAAATFKVLVVDDQLTMREVAKMALKQLGIAHVLTAENGRAALEVVTTQPINLVLSDFNMPELDGLGLLRAIRSHPAVRKLPFILLTGRGDSELVTRAAQAGVNNYVVKPFSADILRQKMEAVVGKLN